MSAAEDQARAFAREALSTPMSNVWHRVWEALIEHAEGHRTKHGFPANEASRVAVVQQSLLNDPDLRALLAERQEPAAVRPLDRVTDEMVDAAYEAFDRLAHFSDERPMRAALEAAFAHRPEGREAGEVPQ